LSHRSYNNARNNNSVDLPGVMVQGIDERHERLQLLGGVVDSGEVVEHGVVVIDELLDLSVQDSAPVSSGVVGVKPSVTASEGSISARASDGIAPGGIGPGNSPLDSVTSDPVDSVVSKTALEVSVVTEKPDVSGAAFDPGMHGNVVKVAGVASPPVPAEPSTETASDVGKGVDARLLDNGVALGPGKVGVVLVLSHGCPPVDSPPGSELTVLLPDVEVEEFTLSVVDLEALDKLVVLLSRHGSRLLLLERTVLLGEGLILGVDLLEVGNSFLDLLRVFDAGSIETTGIIIGSTNVLIEISALGDGTGSGSTVSNIGEGKSAVHDGNGGVLNDRGGGLGIIRGLIDFSLVGTGVITNGIPSFIVEVVSKELLSFILAIDENGSGVTGGFTVSGANVHGLRGFIILVPVELTALIGSEADMAKSGKHLANMSVEDLLVVGELGGGKATISGVDINLFVFGRAGDAANLLILNDVVLEELGSIGRLHNDVLAINGIMSVVDSNLQGGGILLVLDGVLEVPGTIDSDSTSIRSRGLVGGSRAVASRKAVGVASLKVVESDLVGLVSAKNRIGILGIQDGIGSIDSGASGKGSGTILEDFGV
jgi:hypothetical protein